MRPFAVIFALGVLLFCGTASAQCCYTEKDYSGVWRSAGPEDAGDGTYAVREYRFTAKTFTRTVTRYADKALTRPLYAYSAEGTYTVNERWNAEQELYNTSFRITKRSLLLLASEDSAGRFDLGRCGLRKGVEKDISGPGCSVHRSVLDAPVEFDISLREGDSLRFGARPADEDLGTEDKRPRSLGGPLLRTAEK